MKYDVFMSERAWASVLAQAEYIAREAGSPQNADAFLERVLGAIDELETMPRRFGVALEASVTGVEVRAVRLDGYLLLFIVDDAQRRVRIIAARHGRQRPLGGPMSAED
jgi:plasmid stabilization system protein ParE